MTALKWIGGYACQLGSVALVACAAWNTALLAQMPTHAFVPVTLTTLEWVFGAILTFVSLGSHGAVTAQQKAVPATGLLTIEQIESAIAQRIKADQDAQKAALISRLGKVGL